MQGGWCLCLSLWSLASPLCFAGFGARFIAKLPSLFVPRAILASFLTSLALWLCEIALPSLLALSVTLSKGNCKRGQSAIEGQRNALTLTRRCKQVRQPLLRGTPTIV